MISKQQTTNTVFLIKPAHFGYNAETADSNAFQNKVGEGLGEIQGKVLAEFENVVNTLRSSDVQVIVIDDTNDAIKPDAVFPNNWITTHSDGTIALYPMFASNRRIERRADIVELFEKQFQVQRVLDYSHSEENEIFLEGTGSIIFDRINKCAYACLSPRTDEKLFQKVCADLGYTPFSFTALDENGTEIYHTNVMMCIGNGFVVVCLDSVQGSDKKRELIENFAKTGLEIIDISLEQVAQFAGNLLAIQKADGKDVLALSQSAYDALGKYKRSQLSYFTELLPISIPTIETIGGGSVRCMIAEVFLPRR